MTQASQLRLLAACFQDLACSCNYFGRIILGSCIIDGLCFYCGSLVNIYEDWGDKERLHGGWISIFTVFLFIHFPGAFIVFQCRDMAAEMWHQCLVWLLINCFDLVNQGNNLFSSSTGMNLKYFQALCFLWLRILPDGNFLQWIHGKTTVYFLPW